MATVRSGPGGELRLALELPTAALDPTTPDWEVVARETDGESGATTLWVQGRIRVTGEVVADLGAYRRDDVALDLDRVRLTAWAHGDEDTTETESPRGVRQHWLRTHRLARIDLSDDVRVNILDERGRFTAPPFGVAVSND